MSSKGSSCRFFVSRAVEEPLEATFELGEDIKQISGNLQRLVTLGILSLIVFILLLLPSLYRLFYLIFMGLRSDLDLSTEEMYWSIASGLILLFIISHVAMIIIYLIQVHKFNSHLLSRYSLVSELKESDISTKSVPKKKGVDSGLEKGGNKHLKNPIFAMIDLVEESMHELPQMVKLIRFCKYFISIILIFLVSTAVVHLVFDENLIFFLGYWELAFGLIAAGLIIPTLYLLIESERFFRCVTPRHDIIDSIRFDRDINVAEGSDPLERLISYLKMNDPFIERSLVNFKNDVDLEGSSGKKYRFDAHFAGDNDLEEWSAALGIPKGKLSVFIKVFKEDITKEDLQQLSEAVMEVCEKDGTFPLRVIALQWEVAELQDDVYDHVLENPLSLKKVETPLQIVSEDGEIYSFIPMISYGKGVS